MIIRTACCRTLTLFILCLLFVGGCARFPNIGRTTLTPKTYGELERHLMKNKPTLDLFRFGGPFEVERRDNLEIRLSDKEVIAADWFMPGQADVTPLVIFMHGLNNSKDSHAYQALHMATWGMHSLTLQLSPTGPWVGNGRAIARIVEHIQRRPDIFAGRVDTSRIILVGHSFGGASVAIALAEKARAVGGILLDPAGVGRDLPNFLRRVDLPVLVVGADSRVSVTTNRDYFFSFIRAGIAEVSITDASHEDGQFPADDAATTEALQITFAGAVVAGAYSLALTRRFDYAWSSFQDDLRNGKLMRGRKK